MKRGPLDDSLTHEGWQVNLSYMLTGEANSYKGPSPALPVSLENKTWGAWELSGRISGLDIDEDAFDEGYASPTQSVSEAIAYGLSLNWHLNKSVKFVANYELSQFEDGAAGGDRDDEHIIFGRLQFVI